jgi:hypothetical protein
MFVPDPDPGLLPIPDPGSERYRVPDPQHWKKGRIDLDNLTRICLVITVKKKTSRRKRYMSG